MKRSTDLAFTIATVLGVLGLALVIAWTILSLIESAPMQLSTTGVSFMLVAALIWLTAELIHK